MFKKQLTVALLIWLSFVGGCFWLFYLTTSGGQENYHRLINSRGHEMDPEGGASRQTRLGVSKQILYNKGESRLEVRLNSESSSLVYSRGARELIENFKELTCIMQDELMGVSGEGEDSFCSSENGHQLVRQLKSDRASYSYNTGKLKAFDVEIAHYFLSSCKFPKSLHSEKPLFKGLAKSLEVSLFKEPTAHAEDFKAIIHDGGSLW